LYTNFEGTVKFDVKIFGRKKVSAEKIGRKIAAINFGDPIVTKVLPSFMILPRFEALKHLLKDQNGSNIKVLKTNNGNEFCYVEFDKFQREKGIEIHKTNPYTPQHNGFLEWMNRTLMERARSILSEANLEKKFWVEAISTTCYLIDMSPTLCFMDKTPMNFYMRENPSL
jgi:hypothetical protein